MHNTVACVPPLDQGPESAVSGSQVIVCCKPLHRSHHRLYGQLG